MFLIDAYENAILSLLNNRYPHRFEPDDLSKRRIFPFGLYVTAPIYSVTADRLFCASLPWAPRCV